MYSEQWRDVVGYEGLYQVSSLGRVMRVIQRDADGKVVRKAKMLRSSPRDASGRMGVALRKDGAARTHYVDRTVLDAWVGPIGVGQTVLYGRGIADNSVANLSYGSPPVRVGRERKRYRGVCVRRSDGIMFISMAQAAEFSGIDESGIRKVCKGRADRAGGWGWERVD